MTKPIPPSLNRVLDAVLNRTYVNHTDLIGSMGDHQFNMPAFCHGGDGETAMSITYRPEDQATYLKCHSHQCDQDTILRALSLRPGDLYDVRLGEGDTIASTGPVPREGRRPMREFLYNRE